VFIGWRDNEGDGARLAKLFPVDIAFIRKNEIIFSTHKMSLIQEFSYLCVFKLSHYQTDKIAIVRNIYQIPKKAEDHYHHIYRFYYMNNVISDINFDCWGSEKIEIMNKFLENFAERLFEKFKDYKNKKHEQRNDLMKILKESSEYINFKLSNDVHARMSGTIDGIIWVSVL